MASDDGCAPRSAERIASFHRFGLVTHVGLKGSDVVLLATGDYLGEPDYVGQASRRYRRMRHTATEETKPLF
jgi:hypothetical protein